MTSPSPWSCWRNLTRVALCLGLLSWREGSKVEGHGRLIDPPSRATMWRYGFDTKADYDDNAGYCGGKSQLWSRFEGRCGVCGDPWLPIPRAHERGGSYYDGTPVRYYEEGDVITVVMGITANHRGWVEFRLCPYDRPAEGDVEYDDNGRFVEVSQTCLDKHLLQLADGSGTRFYLPEPYRVGEYSVDVVLPSGLSCSKCLLQWKWNVANSWGTDPDGTSCVGCGQQEQFYACADIVIDSASSWYDVDYPPFHPETYPPLPSSPPPQTPGTSDLYPPQTYPPPPDFPNSEHPATTHPWYVPGEGGKGSNPGVPTSGEGDKPPPEDSDGNRDWKPGTRTVDPGTTTPSSVTERPLASDSSPSSPRVPEPATASTTSARPRKDKNEGDGLDSATMTTITTTTATSTGSKDRSGGGWNQAVPSFWKWLLQHSHHRATESPSPERPAPEGGSPRLKISAVGGRKNSKPTPRSWWQKLLSLSAWGPTQKSGALQLQKQKPRSRSKKSTTTMRFPITTITTTTNNTMTLFSDTTTPWKEETSPMVAEKDRKVPTKAIPTSPAMSSTAPNKNLKSSTLRTASMLAINRKAPATLSRTKAVLKTVANKEEEPAFSQADPGVKEMPEAPLPWWLRKAGPAFLFHSWVEEDRTGKQTAALYPQYREIPSKKVRASEGQLPEPRILDTSFPSVQLSKARRLDMKIHYGLFSQDRFANANIFNSHFTETQNSDTHFDNQLTESPNSDTYFDNQLTESHNSDTYFDNQLTESHNSDTYDTQPTESENPATHFSNAYLSENRVFKDLQNELLREGNVVPVPYLAAIDPFLLQRRESQSSREMTEASSGDLKNNEDTLSTSSAFKRNSAHSAAAASSTSHDGEETSRDILLSNKHGFGTVSLGVPFEAANENPFISPAEVSKDDIADSVAWDQTDALVHTKTEQRDTGDTSDQAFNIQFPRSPNLSNENLPSHDTMLLQDGLVISQSKAFLLPDGYDAARIGYLSLQPDARLLAQDLVCTPVGGWIRYSEMWRWCQLHCRGGYCPFSHCMCA